MIGYIARTSRLRSMRVDRNTVIMVKLQTTLMMANIQFIEPPSVAPEIHRKIDEKK